VEIPRAPGQQRQALVQPRQQRPRREGLQPRRRQLEGQRQAIQARAGGQEVGHQRRGVQHLLEVIEQQQEVPVPQRVLEAIRQGLPADLVQLERVGDGRRHEVGIADGREVHEGGAVGEVAAPRRRQFHSQARLADAAGADEGEQSPGGIAEQCRQPRQLGIATEQRRGRGWQRRVPCRGRRPGRAAASKAARPLGSSSSAVASRRTVSNWGLVLPPRSRALIARAETLARSASASWLSPARTRWCRSSGANGPRRAVVMASPGIPAACRARHRPRAGDRSIGAALL